MLLSHEHYLVTTYFALLYPGDDSDVFFSWLLCHAEWQFLMVLCFTADVISFFYHKIAKLR